MSVLKHTSVSYKPSFPFLLQRKKQIIKSAYADNVEAFHSDPLFCQLIINMLSVYYTKIVWQLPSQFSAAD